MIIDRLANAARYYPLSPRLAQAFAWLQNTGLHALPAGKHVIDGDNLFAIVQEYETMDSANEKMEAHLKHIDVQYMIQGEELVGHALLNGQQPSVAYDAANDFMLFGEAPSFFTVMAAGTFMIFYPADLHMPCIKTGEPAMVKKVVVKVKIAE